MSNTTGCPIPTASFSEVVFQAYTASIPAYFQKVGLLGGLYGIITVLSVLSVYALIRRSTNVQPIAVVLCLTILALFTSTTLYMVTTILFCQSYLQDVITNTQYLWNYDVAIDLPVMPLTGIELVKKYTAIQACAGTAALTINVVLGDAIVCWRTCVVWQGNYTVRIICGLFLLATLILAAIDSAFACQYSPFKITYFGDVIGSLFEGLPVGIAACALSLSTNLLATLLVGYKAWESRRRLKGYLVDGVVASRVEKLFSLLIESGIVYCAIWAVAIVWEVGEYKPKPSAAMLLFDDVFGIIMEGALVPAIAIYPTLIIVLVAFHKSHTEKALTARHLSDIPTPHLATLNTITTNHHSNRLHRRSEVLARNVQAAGSGDSLADASACTNQEGDSLKAERIL